jgi:YegS/Rv2252/BmrU family lipid kinase
MSAAVFFIMIGVQKRATLIINPAARVMPSQRSLAEAIEWIRRADWELTVQTTEAPGHATSLARHAAELGQELVIVCGGDGTISEAAHGLAGTGTALAVMPAGTARVWAKEAKLPRRPLTAAQVAVEGQAYTIDLGRADGRHFFMMAGVGLDGRIAQRISPRMKRHLGATAYAIIAAREALRHKGSPVTIRLDVETLPVTLMMMIVGNTRNYAGITELTPLALANDGLLDVCIFEGNDTRSIVGHALRVMARKHVNGSNVVYRKVRSVEILDDALLPVQLDGDFWSDRPKTFEVAPNALKMVLPRGLLPPTLRSP